jgi:hypothetical protein
MRTNEDGTDTIVDKEIQVSIFFCCRRKCAALPLPAHRFLRSYWPVGGCRYSDLEEGDEEAVKARQVAAWKKAKGDKMESRWASALTCGSPLQAPPLHMDGRGTDDVRTCLQRRRARQVCERASPATQQQQRRRALEQVSLLSFLSFPTIAHVTAIHVAPRWWLCVRPGAKSPRAT